ncbi:low temperature requirement protein A [Rhizobium sp. CG5]|nr:low temperature requirement protein A [Rhizobium sp. CG5]
MRGRDPHEAHRVATPLELLFDLTFVIAFSAAASPFAHLMAEGHFAVGLGSFAFAMFAICLAWINFSWFASAFDTDDWIYRVTTMIQMIGVLILAVGLPRMFTSLDHGGYIDNAVMVMGYVIMRVAMIFQWLRAARQYPGGRAACLFYAGWIFTAQIGWTILIFVDLPLLPTAACILALGIFELAGPIVAERLGNGTPWHAHHIAERYGLLAIIALGEGVIGTVASISAIVESQGWSMDTVLMCVAGTGLTFGMWWLYFMLPSAKVLHIRRDRAFVWGYGHMLIFAAIAATGAGLHVAAYYIEHEAHIGAVATLLTVALPVGLYILTIFALHTYLLGERDRFHVWLLAGTALFIVLPVVCAGFGVSMTVCLTLLMLAPAVAVIGYEVVGHRHGDEAFERMLSGMRAGGNEPSH